MKIAIASTGLGHVARGIETWAKDTAAALHRRGVDVTLFRGSGPATLPYEQVATRCIPRTSPTAQRLEKWFPPGAWRFGFGSAGQIEQTSFGWSLLPALAAGKFDLIHLQDPWLAQTLLRRQARHGTRIVYMNGTEEPLEFLNQFPFVQEQSPHYMNRHQPKAGQRRFCVPSFVNVDLFTPGDRATARRELGLPADEFLVVSVGALRKTRKRMDWLVREFATVPGKLVLAGAREPETEAFLAHARQTLGDRVVVLEKIAHAQMPRLYQAADVFVLCSLEEIFGLAFVEAMACGTPCLGHTFPVTEWVIGDGGICVDMEATGSLARQLERCADAGLREKFGRQARQRVETMFSEPVVVEQMLAMYREVLE